ncbi:MAG: hypothetical protein COW04_11975 [Deltaproteobacteria bacterium CG12_big_fil_rev_8_21_14_0_65_43_10]|nr:MAG: hypothetical protein AUK23_01365 [Deltaproteobacteria bacterium CG2_30_43_15]PIQ44615.1 MAG: hypothetical protein COW04_11975 [Deltaproteobacteria bacterium CG12_big_fil_rev_8_21_14_0_65_43_10]PIU84345.1 MAG: hypothetical protein COS67_13775 [Deltaproteobacteria bacterium CG06_land_8_20_14_3_00_44_19]PIX24930.1 MAG: hypothetical protein COZ68_05100 [Deltaproteobacteria bacterium CG_4_8_14_3_um_filter_43_13]PJB43288.1 MAG: hypothetical protein CO106_04795 [Deltaproteobacteria bacterium C
MVDKKVEPKEISMSNTKQEMLATYNALLKQLHEKEEAEPKPEKKMEEKKMKEVVAVADSLSSEGVVKGISSLKLEVGKMLTQISDRLEEEVNKFKGIQKAIEIKEGELKEVYEIERSAATLVALIESQNQKRREFESEIVGRKEELNREIQTISAEWEKEKNIHEADVKEREATEAKRREREKEEYHYAFKREQQLAKDNFEDEKAKLEREIQLKKEQMEKDLAEREKAIAERENELNELQKKVSAFPKEMETAVNKAIKETTEKILLEATNKENLLKKEFNGERNVFTSRIESLEKTVKEQTEQIAKLSEQLEKAYQKVQDIAVKAVEGSSNIKSLTSLQQMVTEQTRRQSQEK